MQKPRINRPKLYSPYIHTPQIAGSNSFPASFNMAERQEPQLNFLQDNTPNDIFDPFVNKAVREKHGAKPDDTFWEGLAVTGKAMGDLVSRQFTSYSDGPLNGVLTNLGLIGESLDKVTGLPVRAVVNKAQTGEDWTSAMARSFTTNEGVTGQTIREQSGMDANNDIGNWILDMAAEILLDPTTYLSFGASAVGKMDDIGRVGKTIQTLDKVENKAIGSLMYATPLGIPKAGMQVMDYVKPMLTNGKAYDATALSDEVRALYSNTPDLKAETTGKVEFQVTQDQLNANEKTVQKFQETYKPKFYEEPKLNFNEQMQDNVHRLFLDVTKDFDMYEYFEDIATKFNTNDYMNIDLKQTQRLATEFKELAGREGLDPFTKQVFTDIQKELTGIRNKIHLRQVYNDDVLNAIELFTESGFDYTNNIWTEEMYVAFQNVIEPFLDKVGKANLEKMPRAYQEVANKAIELTRYSDDMDKVTVAKALKILKNENQKALRLNDGRVNALVQIMERPKPKLIQAPESLAPTKSKLDTQNLEGRELEAMSLELERQLDEKLDWLMVHEDNPLADIRPEPKLERVLTEDYLDGLEKNESLTDMQRLHAQLIGENVDALRLQQYDKDVLDYVKDIKVATSKILRGDVQKVESVSGKAVHHGTWKMNKKVQVQVADHLENVLKQLELSDFSALSRYQDQNILVDHLLTTLADYVKQFQEAATPTQLIKVYEDYLAEVYDFFSDRLGIDLDASKFKKQIAVNELTGNYSVKAGTVETPIEALAEPLFNLGTAGELLETGLKDYQNLSREFEANAYHLQMNKNLVSHEIMNNLDGDLALNNLRELYFVNRDNNILRPMGQHLESVKTVNRLVDSLFEFKSFLSQLEMDLSVKHKEFLKKGGSSVDFRTMRNYKYDDLYQWIAAVRLSTKNYDATLAKIQKHKNAYELMMSKNKPLRAQRYLDKAAALEQKLVNPADVKKNIPASLKDHKDLINQYLEQVETRGLEFGQQPDKYLASAMKFASDDLKDRFALLGEVNDDMRHLANHAIQTLTDAKNSIRQSLGVYKSESRRLRGMFVSNEKALAFAKSKGYNDISEYIRYENPRVTLKMGAQLEADVTLRGMLKELFPGDKAKRQQLFNDIQVSMYEHGVDQTIATQIFKRIMDNPLPDETTVHKDLYEMLFPGNSYKGNDMDKALKQAMYRTKVIGNSETLVDFVASKLLPPNPVTDIKDFGDSLRHVYQQYANRPYIEALHQMINQATADTKNYMKQYQGNMKQLSTLRDMYEPLKFDDFLAEIQKVPFLSINNNPKLTTYEEAKTILKANPQLRFVAAVVDETSEHGFKIKEIPANTKVGYDKAKKLNAMVLDYESAQHLQAMFKSNPFKDQPLLRFWQKWFVQTYKVQALINVGFHMTNLFDVVLKNQSAGNPKAMWHLLKGQLDYLNYQHKWRFLDAKDLTPDQLEVVNFYKTLASGGGVTADKVLDGVSLPERFRQWMLYDNPISKGNQAMGNFIEEGARLGLYRQNLSTGMSQSRALYEGMKTHFDYSNKSDAMLWAELVFPFTTFAVRNLFFWSARVMENPKLVEYIYEGLQYNYDEHGADLDSSYIQSQMARGNLIMDDKIIRNGNSLLDAMRFVSSNINAGAKLLKGEKLTEEDTYDNMLSRFHPIISATFGEGGVEAFQNKTYADAIPMQRQGETMDKIIASHTQQPFRSAEKPNSLGFWNTIAYTYYRPSEGSDYQRNPYDKSYTLSNYPDYPRTSRYYPKYTNSRSYRNARMPKAYWFKAYNNYNKLYTKKGVSLMKMRLSATNYKNLEYRINKKIRRVY